MKNKKIIIISIIMLVSLSIIFVLYSHKKTNNKEIKTNNEEIKCYSFKTHGEFNKSLGRKNQKYKIRNKKEFETFKKLFKGFPMTYQYNLSEYTIFIQIQIEGSGSNKVNLKNVKLNDKVMFIIDTNKPSVGTCDMAYWYLVAVIPKNKLNKINVDEWKSPNDYIEYIYE